MRLFYFLSVSISLALSTNFLLRFVNGIDLISLESYDKLLTASPFRVSIQPYMLALLIFCRIIKSLMAFDISNFTIVFLSFYWFSIANFSCMLICFRLHLSFYWLIILSISNNLFEWNNSLDLGVIWLKLNKSIAVKFSSGSSSIFLFR